MSPGFWMGFGIGAAIAMIGFVLTDNSSVLFGGIIGALIGAGFAEWQHRRNA